MLSFLLDRNYLHLYQAKFRKLNTVPRGLKITINKPSTALKECLVISFLPILKLWIFCFDGFSWLWSESPKIILAHKKLILLDLT